jgi:hypothetical protein
MRDIDLPPARLIFVPIPKIMSTQLNPLMLNSPIKEGGPILHLDEVMTLHHEPVLD